MKLSLQEGICIRPLSRKQIQERLRGAGKHLDGFRATLRDDPRIWELLESPLMLEIAILAFKDKTAKAVRLSGTAEERRNQLLAAYVDGMFKRGKHRGLLYPRERVERWLGWLACRLRSHNQTILYLEKIKLDWLPGKLDRRLISIGTAIVPGILVYVGILVVRSNWLLALLVATFLACGIAAIADPDPVETVRWSRSGLKREFGWYVLGLGCVTGVIIFVLGLAQGFGPFAGYLVLALGMIVAALAMSGLVDYVAEKPLSPNDGTRRSALTAVGTALAVGGITTAVSLPGHLLARVSLDFVDYLMLVVIAGFGTGGIHGGLFFLRHILVRVSLARHGFAPLRYVRFLNYATDMVFLRRVGGGYRFVHRLLQEYFDSLNVSRDQLNGQQATSMPTSNELASPS